MRSILAFAALLALTLSGCSVSNGADGQSAAGKGLLAYNGASPGSHQTTLHCDGSATLHWNGNLGSGKVDVRVLDGAGAQKLSILYSKVGQSSDSKPASGAEGTWTLKVERVKDAAYGSWSGQYEVHLEC